MVTIQPWVFITASWSRQYDFNLVHHPTSEHIFFFRKKSPGGIWTLDPDLESRTYSHSRPLGYGPAMRCWDVVSWFSTLWGDSSSKVASRNVTFQRKREIESKFSFKIKWLQQKEKFFTLFRNSIFVNCKLQNTKELKQKCEKDFFSDLEPRNEGTLKWKQKKWNMEFESN